MRFRSNITPPRIDAAALAAEIDRRMRDATEQAARVWLREALQAVPDWSGASRATFEQLASSVGEHVDINVSRTAPDRIALGRLNSRGGCGAGGGWALAVLLRE